MVNVKNTPFLSFLWINLYVSDVFAGWILWANTELGTTLVFAGIRDYY